MSGQDVLVGIDAGTSMIKAVAFAIDGRMLASRSRQNHYVTRADGAVEQDMERTLNDTVAVLAELVSSEPDIAARIVGLAVTGQGDGTWLADADGNPVQDAWLWLDSRSADEARRIASSAAFDHVYERTGTGITACQMSAQMSWMQKHDRSCLSAAATAFHCKDWLYYRLTGDRAADPSEAVFTFGSYATRDYDESVIDALGLGSQRHLLPPIIDGMKVSGALGTTVARRIGLPAGLPVTLGYIDVVCSALGVGLYGADQDVGVSILGSTGIHLRRVSEAADIVLNASRSGFTICIPDGGLVQVQSNMAATLNIDWLLDLVDDATRFAGHAADRDTLLLRLDADVAVAPAGRVIYHPYLSSAGERGPFIDASARASFVGLDSTCDFSTLARGVYEGLAWAARDCFDAMGRRPAEIRLSGGAARSTTLSSIIASVLGSTVRSIDRAESGAAGACMIAACGQGIHASLEICSREWVDTRLGEPIEPDTALNSLYEKLAPAYPLTRELFTPIWHALAQRRHRGESTS